MNDGIFVMTNGHMSVLHQTTYDNEDKLQTLLEQYPELIAGVATGDEHRRLLLVKREAAIASSALGAAGYSLDHLYVDSEAVPVFVEVKLSRDTRIRREVVGQLLDYVALGVPDWREGKMRVSVKAAHPGVDEKDLLADHLGWQGDPDSFWSRVESNLAQKRVRMIFVADHLPEDLVRVIEFLNEQMRDVDVLGVEVPMYGSSAQVQAFVPKVKGDTAAARETKEQWTFETFMSTATNQGLTTGELDVIRTLLMHAERYGRPSYGKVAIPGVNAWYQLGQASRPTWYLTTNGGPGKAYMYFYPQEVAKHAGEPIAIAFAAELAKIPHLRAHVEAAQASDWGKWPSIQLNKLAADPSLLSVVITAVDIARQA